MPRPPKIDPLRAYIREIGREIGRELAETVARTAPEAAGRTAGGPRRRGRRPLSDAEARCRVPGCIRRRAAKGICQNHYAKARRLRMNLEKLSDANLRTLAEDARSTRFKK